MVLPDGATLTLTRDAAGREATRSAGGFARTREYNLMGWLTRESSGQEQDGRLRVEQTREYRYDGAGNLKAVRHNRQATGFELDSSGRVLSVQTGGAGRSRTTEEVYGYTRSGQPQNAGRLVDWQAGRLVQQDDTHYRYDRAGRLVSRQRVQPGYRGQVWHYRWDSRNQLRQLETPDGQRWEYRYDSFGRRISKRHGDEEVRFLWDGDQIAEVRHYRHNVCVSRRHWVYNGWELLVQQRQLTADAWETDFVTSDQNGAPQALYGDDGVQRWAAPKATLWGRRTSNGDALDPGLAFAGQYRDSESGLCYNRFRYYDPDGGCYISPDPIGVLGGESNYGYVHNPVGWVDPFGLAGCSSKGFNKRDRITSRWTDRLTGKKPADVHDYLTSKGWSRTYPQAGKPGAIQHTQYVKTTKAGTTYKLDYHPGGSGSQKNIHGNDYWKVYRDVNGKDVVYGRIGYGGFKNYDLITDSPVYIDGVLMNGGL